MTKTIKAEYLPGGAEASRTIGPGSRVLESQAQTRELNIMFCLEVSKAY